MCPSSGILVFSTISISEKVFSEILLEFIHYSSAIMISYTKAAWFNATYSDVTKDKMRFFMVFDLD